MALSEPTDDYDRFYYLEDGLTLKIGMMSESSGKGSFYKATSIEFRKRRKQYDISILEGLPSLDDLIVYRSYDDLRALFQQEEIDGDAAADYGIPAEENDDWIDRPQVSTKTKAKKPHPTETDIPWDADDIDETVSPPPKRRAVAVVDDHQHPPIKPKKEIPQPEIEEDEDWDDDEEEAEPIAPKKKRVVEDEEEDEDWST